MTFNRSHRWIAYVPIKLHILSAALFAAIGDWFAFRCGWKNERWVVLSSMLIGGAIGVALEMYKERARKFIEQESRDSEDDANVADDIH